LEDQIHDDFKDYIVEQKNFGRDFPNEGGGVVPNNKDYGG